MSAERGPLQVPFDTSLTQAKASHPHHSVWVEANAGSGKTFVLTQRVLRLLLAGVEPQTVLCLTYTKAAAAEMRQRVGAQLAAWAVAGDAELHDRLEALTGQPPQPGLAGLARTLFAKALETPGGLRIQTIHAFCEAVLHRFPIEAGVPFDFSVIEDDQREGMILAAREAVLAEGLRGGEHAAAVESLFGLMSDDAITKAINVALAEGARLRAVLDDVQGAKERLAQLLGGTDRPAAAINAATLAESLLTPQLLREIVLNCGGDPTGNSKCADLLARLDPDRPHLEGLRAAFFNGKGEPRTRLMVKKEIEAFPHLHAVLQAEQQRLDALRLELQAAEMMERSGAVLDMIAAIHQRYTGEKRHHSMLDFDDLVERLGDLLTERSMGPWVRYKLDAGIDHILVDESQDTNDRQWRVVRALAEEFFAGEGAVQRPRSLFAVGDQKQSIYSFQGAEPVLFAQTGREFARRAKQAERHFEAVKLHTSFRTLPGILAAVDAVCSREDIRLALLSEDRVGHAPARTQSGGTVTLWPPIAEVKLGRDDTQWPEVPLDAEQSAARQVALRIAREIRGWLSNGRLLGERGRPVAADDVLVLVQSRSVLFHEIIRALRAEGVPTPGADRLGVTSHIAVLDLLALIDVLLNPADSLQLAALLRSPLFDVTEEALFEIAHDRAGQSLWQALCASPHPAAREAAERLNHWRASLDFERPYEFLAAVLYAQGGLKRFHARLGPEVDEVLSELLALALAHEQDSQPSLQGFAHAIRRRRNLTIKRELADAGAGVRVMTVHGAKGLEAPIVILADAASKPNGQQTGKPVYIVTDRPPGPLLIHASRADQHVPATLSIKAEIDNNQAQEYWRRLYVGMTRAEDELYVTGTLTQKGSLDGTWFEAIEQALRAECETVEDGDGVVQALVYPQRLPDAGQPWGRITAPHRIEPLTVAAVAEPKRAAIVFPSRTDDHAGPEVVLQSLAEQARDAEAARKSGLALHALLQHLGRVPRQAWAQVAPRALEALMPEYPEEHGRIAGKAIAILSQPALGPLFGPNSRAEVPFLIAARRREEPVRLSGRIDRLVVDDSKVLVVDYKSDATVPSEVADVPERYRRQLGIYALVAGQLFPGRTIQAAILWTELGSLMNLPPELLSEATGDFTLR
ncbi:double-strand break repair helicase AddA [Devosia sp. PTR5]|uniref:DNA 3'-5' helicase n=1 Tax=Devosia oryzisoli TaxID=2774138 RepID=A0A927FWE4_9HYPH|nr:double-strand break repair helicase AddA [Devosia oryzisoli]MBD8066374.1 double-strand break repair helicase AddA [Devosia oryzisoli]